MNFIFTPILFVKNKTRPWRRRWRMRRREAINKLKELEKEGLISKEDAARQKARSRALESH